MPRVIVVGSGIAGLFAAICAHRRGVRDLAIVTKAALEDGATRYAQGGITVRDRAFVSDLIVEAGACRGIRLRGGEEMEADAIVLAAGGAGQLYASTTNPTVSTGDGVALGLRAGAVVADLELFQFHPTAFAAPGGWRFLVSEAVRGHGAVLRNHRGEAFMARYDARAELAPRDVVSRGIVREMARHGLPNVWLDAIGAGAWPGDGVELHETANVALVGWVMTEAALRREESRGAHHRLDFPEPRASWRRRQSFVLPSFSPRRGPAFGEAAPTGAEVHT